MKTIKVIILIVILLLNVTNLSSQNRSIDFEKGSWIEILKKAENQNKLIFLDAYAAWCGPCKWMAANIFTDDKVADFYNKNFINAKIDMEKGEGIDLAKKYDVKVYPTLLVINSNGELVHRGVGSMPADKFIEFGNDALNPEKQFIKLQKQFDKGERGTEFMMEYLDKLNSYYMNLDYAISEYFKTQKEADYLKKHNWELMKKYVNSPSSEQFLYLLKNKAKFSSAFTADSVEDKIINVYLTKLTQMLSRKEKSFDSMLAVAVKNLKDPKKLTLQIEVYKARRENNWKDYGKSITKYIDSYVIRNKNINSGFINQHAWTIYEKIDDKATVKKAAGWMKKVIEKDKNAAFLDTYACLLAKSGDKKQAVKIETEALELAKKDGDDQLIEDLKKNIEEWSK